MTVSISRMSIDYYLSTVTAGGRHHLGRTRPRGGTATGLDSGTQAAKQNLKIEVSTLKVSISTPLLPILLICFYCITNRCSRIINPVPLQVLRRGRSSTMRNFSNSRRNGGPSENSYHRKQESQGSAVPQEKAN